MGTMTSCQRFSCIKVTDCHKSLGGVFSNSFVQSVFMCFFMRAYANRVCIERYTILNSQYKSKAIIKTATQRGLCHERKTAMANVDQIKNPGKISKERYISRSFLSLRSL